MKEHWKVADPGILDGVTVWSVDLGGVVECCERCAAVLPLEETARASRFRRAEDRHRFIASHAALRLILGRALNVAPRDLAFTHGEAGKPELAGTWSGALRFNLSHSGDRALVGLSPEHPIGVDVEALRPMPDAVRVARSYFAPEEAAALSALPDDARDLTFMSVWTRKEAVVKALGAGLSLPLNRFGVSQPPGPPRILFAKAGILDPAAFSLMHLEPGPGAVGAVAVAAPDVRLGLRALPQGWAELIA